MSIIGIFAILLLAYLLSGNRKKINLRIVGSAFLLQFGIAAFVLYTSIGKTMLGGMSNSVQTVIDFSNAGIEFLFGGLTSESIGFVFAVKVLPVIIFITALVSIMYYLNVMQFLVRWLGSSLRWVLGVSRIESLVAAASIFLDQTQSSLVVKPYLKKLDKVQFFTIMCSGLASVSGAVLAGYASLGVNLEYLIAAAFMAAPGGLLMAKMIMPGESSGEIILDKEEASLFGNQSKPANVVEAAANGAIEGLKLAATIGGMLVAFVAIIALFNGILSGIGGLFGFPSLSLDWLLGNLFSPLMVLLGIPWDESAVAGNLIGQKLILNEFIAFVSLAELQDSLSAHTNAVVTFALCGFANFASLAILLGGLGSIVPERKSEIAQVGFKVIAAGTLSNLMSAAMASTLLLLG